MSKPIILANIKKLADAVIIQQRNLEMLNKGVAVSVDKMSTREECSFMSWFREDGKYLKEYVHGSTLDEVAALYSEWFMTYEKIYKLFYSKITKSWFGRKIQGPKKLDEMEQAKLEAYLDDIEGLNVPLLRKLEILQRRVEHNTAINADSYSAFFINNSDYRFAPAV